MARRCVPMGSDAIWDAFTHEDIIAATPNAPLPECNRGSWFCPVADSDDAEYLDDILSSKGFDRVYDFGAGDCRFAVDMDRRGYEVVAYETIQHIAEFGLSHFPDHDVTLVNADYYSQWPAIGDDEAAFVALGKLNQLPGEPTNGIGFDSMAIPSLWTYERFVEDAEVGTDE